MNDFIKLLKDEAYAGLDTIGHVPDFFGLCRSDLAPVFQHLLESRFCGRKELLVVEVGSYVGWSAIKMAEVCASRGVKVTILCVDTWLGSPEFYTQSHWLHLKKVQGYPTIFHHFTRNIKSLGFHDVIVPLPLASASAAELLAHYKVEPDLIYVDAAHEYESVKMDLSYYWKLLKSGGVMFGDDFSWPGVKKAVEEFCAEKIVQLHNMSEIMWWVFKN